MWAATDCCPVEVATWQGLGTYEVLVVRELATRRVQGAGSTPPPTAACMQQDVRQVTDPLAGFLLGQRSLLPDRDAPFPLACDGRLKDSSVEPSIFPPRSPNRTAHCERFGGAIKEEALEQMLMLGERSRHTIIREYRAHDHQERHHQGLRKHLIAPEPGIGSPTGQVGRRERLNGLLRSSHREAA